MKKLAWMLCLALLAAPAMAKGKPIIVKYDDADLARASVSASGEVRISTTFAFEGKTYPVRLSFRDMASGQSVPPGRRMIALDRIDKVLVIDDEGAPKVVDVDGMGQVLELVESATRSICGATVARTFLDLGATTVAINFEHNLAPRPADPQEASGFQTGGSGGTIRCSGFRKDDMDNDCNDHWNPFNGCGDSCANYQDLTCWGSGGLPVTVWYTVTHGTCTEVEESGWNSCFCNGNGEVDRFCWNPQTQHHDPC